MNFKMHDKEAYAGAINPAHCRALRLTSGGLWRVRRCSFVILPQLMSKDKVDAGSPGVCRIPQGRARFRIEVFSHSTLLRHSAEIYAQIVCETALTDRI